MEIWSGIDVSKKTFVASWVPSTVGLDDFQSIPYREFERSPEGVRQYCRWLHQQGEGPTGVVMEATGRYSLELLMWLVRERPDLAPAIVNPRQAKHFHKGLGLRNKTDAVDARSLGLMGCQQKPRSYQAPAPEYRQLRELMRQRLDRQVDQLLVDSPHLGRDLALLISIPGVGRVVALTVLGELGDLRRFERSRQVSAYSGLTPANQESGSSRKSSHLDRNGITELRAVLYLAAMSACCNAADNHMARTYQKLQHRGKTKKQALTVVARKILVMMRAILIHEKPYIDDFSRLTIR